MLIHYIEVFLFLRWWHTGVDCHCWLWFLPLSSCGGDSRVPCGISTIPRVSRSLHSKGPSLSSDDILFCNMLPCSDMPMFSHAIFPNLSQKHWLGFAQDFCLDLCFCGCCPGEPFAKGDLDAEWDAVARQCPAYCWGAFRKQYCVDAIACWWMLIFVDACNAWSSLPAGLHAGLHQRCWGTLKHCFSHLFCFVSSFDDVEEGWGNPTI